MEMSKAGNGVPNGAGPTSPNGVPDPTAAMGVDANGVPIGK